MAAGVSSDDSVSALSLTELFSAGWRVQRDIDEGKILTSDKNFKDTVLDAIQKLEDATRLVSELGLFSINESIEEVSTNDLKYLLLPALLGDLVYQLMNDGDRMSSLDRTQIYFRDFLQRCKNYAVTNEDVPAAYDVSTTEDHAPVAIQRVTKTMEQMEAERRDKIARLKAKKEAENKLRELSQLLQSCNLTSKLPDDETLREHMLAHLRLWVFKANDNLHSVHQEMDLLHQMKHMKKDLTANATVPMATSQPRPPMKPFVITKEMLKEKVFGAGYPSLPTMSVEEFYEQRYSNMPPLTSASQDKGSNDNDDARKEETESEEEERLRRERNFDEFKDTNRRGWGNRKNQG